VTVLTLSACEQVDLALAATPFSAGVQVEDAKRLCVAHAGRMPLAARDRNAGARLVPQLTGPNVR
jgi:hypothetical protein